jgi:hypothetical protein
MFSVGDIVRIYDPTTGYPKYHLCIFEVDEHGVCQFLYINSGQGYEGDFVVADTDIDCLPRSPTGDSVFSCNYLVRYNERQMKLYKAQKLSVLSSVLAVKLHNHIAKLKTLPRPQIALILQALENYCHP